MARINLDVVMLQIQNTAAVTVVALDRIPSGNSTGWASPSATTFDPQHLLQHMYSPSEPKLQTQPGGCLERKLLGRLTRSQLSKRRLSITFSKA